MSLYWLWKYKRDSTTVTPAMRLPPVTSKRRHRFKTLKEKTAQSSSNVTRKILADHEISTSKIWRDGDDVVGRDDLLKISFFQDGVFREKDSDKTDEVCL